MMRKTSVHLALVLSIAPVLLAKPAAKPQPPVTPKVSFADRADQITAPRTELRDAVRQTILAFKDGLAPEDIASDISRAEFAFADFTLKEYRALPQSPKATLRLHAKFTRNRKSSSFVSECRKCEATAVEWLVYDLLDRTLLDSRDGLYRPIPISRCEVKELMVIDTIVQPNGTTLQKSIPYIVAEWAIVDGRPDWKPVGPRLDVVHYDRARTQATFRLVGHGHGITNFKKADCKSTPPRPIAAKPRMTLLSSGDVNGNVSSASR